MATVRPSPGERADEVRAILPELAARSGCDDWVESRAPLQRRDCRIHFLRSATFRLPELVLKTFRGNHSRRDHARVLFRKSCSFHGRSTERCTVPEHLLLSGNALVMEYVAAPLAGNLLIRRFASPAGRAEIIRRSAEWLRWFHSHAEVSPGDFDPSPVRAAMERLERRIREQNGAAWENERFLQDCVARVSRYAEEMSGTPLLHGVVHGDYTPFNIFVGASKTYGFDYNEFQRRHVHQDICRFLLYLDIYRIRPPSDGELAAFGGRGNDCENFFAAYGEDAMPERESWLGLQFMEATRRLGSIALQRSKGKGHRLRFIEIAYLRRKLHHIARQLG